MIQSTPRRHSSTGHDSTCHCGRPATWHVAYGSGCGNVCTRHRDTVVRIKRSVVATPIA